jgi:hypothetical protein
LSPIETAELAQREESLDLFVHTADCLNFSPLVDRAGYRKALPDRDAREGREYGVEFG